MRSYYYLLAVYTAALVALVATLSASTSCGRSEDRFARRGCLGQSCPATPLESPVALEPLPSILGSAGPSLGSSSEEEDVVVASPSPSVAPSPSATPKARPTPSAGPKGPHGNNGKHLGQNK